MIKRLICLLLVMLMVVALIACTPDDQAQTDGGSALKFEYNGVSMAPGDDFADIGSKLGDPDGYYEAASCAFDGKDKIYTFGSVQISVSPMDGKDIIYMITLLDDSLTTPEGIRVGDDKASVIATYGEQGTDKGSSLTYNSEKTDLVLLIRDDCVTSVQYRYVDAVING